MATMSAGIADWVRNTTIDKLPPEVVEQTKLRILDLLGVMLASKDLPTAKAGKRADGNRSRHRGDDRRREGSGLGDDGGLRQRHRRIDA